jgi:predicted dehydrogenase
MYMEQYPAAIVGLGRIASLLEDDARREKPCTHAGAIAANPCLSLAAGCDTNEERRRLFAERWGVPVYAGAEEMLLTHRPSLLVVATHPESHYHYCRLAASLGVRVIVCEKPLDVLWHDGTHLADALMFLGGGILKHRRRRGTKLSSRAGTAWLEGVLKTGTGRDHGDPAFVPFVIEIGVGRDHLVFEIEFSCEKGRLVIGNGVFEVWESRESPYAENFRSLFKTGETFEGPTGYFASMMADAAACIRETEREPVSSAARGLEVIEYLHSVKPWG